MWQDLIWRQRVRVSGLFLLDVVDHWCREGDEFPLSKTVAGLLYVFSARFDPMDTPESNIRERIFEHTGTPRAEYLLTWPKRSDSQASELTDALSTAITEAVSRWADGSLRTTSIDSVIDQVMKLIVAKQYTIFHHFQTTRRDSGGFHCSG